MIEIKNVTKKYGNYVAVEDISFKVEESSIYGLVGYNGAGKTTLLKTAAGILKPESGEVLFDSQNVYDNGKVRSSLLYVPDEVYFVKGASLQKMGKIYKGYFPNFNSKVFKNMTEAMGLDPKKNIGSFSKGMQRQAEVVLAMSTMPKYLILDEPIDGLDPVARKLVWKYIIDDVAQRNLTVLISSHNLKELEGIVDHVGILYKGKIMKEFDLEYIQTHIHKIQVSFGDKEVHLDDLNIAYQEERGSVKILIIEDSLSNIRKVIGDQSPLIFDILPLSLEELFIYEVGGEDDDVQKLIF